MTKEPADDPDSAQLGLLEAAVLEGYFAVPRETTLVELAADQEISTQTASKRLRTALQQVLAPLFSDPASEPTPDLLFRAVAAKKRRWVLYYLQQQSPVSREELTDIVVGWYASEAGPLGPDARPTVASALSQVHLPLLESAGFVSYDPETVTLEPLSESQKALLDASHRIDEATGESATPIPVGEQAHEDQ